MLRLPATFAPLALVFIDSNGQRGMLWPKVFAERRQEFIHKIARDFFGGRVRNWQEHAVLGGENPTSFVVGRYHFVRALIMVHMDLGMPRRQEDMMVQSLGNSHQLVTQRDKIDHVSVDIQGPFDPATNSVVMPVQPFANRAGKGNKMGSAKGQLLFAEVHGKGLLRHGNDSRNAGIRYFGDQ